MPQLPRLYPWINRSLSALLLVAVTGQYFAILGGIVATAVLLQVGMILGPFAGILVGIKYGIRFSKQIPLRESLVLFLSCTSVEILVAEMGNAADWGPPLSVICAILLGPIAGMVVHKRVASLGPVRCRSIAQTLLIAFLLAYFTGKCLDLVVKIR